MPDVRTASAPPSRLKQRRLPVGWQGELKASSATSALKHFREQVRCIWLCISSVAKLPVYGHCSLPWHVCRQRVAAFDDGR